MDIAKTWAEQPVGMRDVYPQQAKYRRLMETRLLDFFDGNGFEQVSSGAFEYVETVLRGREASDADDFFRLFDAMGRMVVMRPDMTPSIARMAAPLVDGGAKEIRWSYAEKVYRRSNDPASLSWASGKAAESTQVGVEWIGSSGADVDAALMALCQSAVVTLGLEDWQIVVSHARFAPALFAAFGVPETAVKAFIQCLVTGDYVGFRQTQADLGLAVDLLRLLSSLNPFDPDSFSAVTAVSPIVDGQSALVDRAALRDAARLWDELARLADVLTERGLANRVAFDLSLCRDLSYYTGVVFEVIAQGAGAPVALGGRYDNLLAQFGAGAPAVGFTFEIERLLTAMTQGRWLVASQHKESSQ